MPKQKTQNGSPRIVPTLEEIAESLAVSTRRVSQLKVEGMPVHSIDAAQAWRTAQAKADGGDFKDQLIQARIKLVREQERRIRYENEEASGRLVSRAECAEAWTRVGCAVAAMLRVVESEIPRACLGLPIHKALPIAKAKMAAIQKTFADAESAFWKTHPENPDAKP
jgi:hypothetical protein